MAKFSLFFKAAASALTMGIYFCRMCGSSCEQGRDFFASYLSVNITQLSGSQGWLFVGYYQLNRRGGVVVKAFTFQSVGLGSIPLPNYTKYFVFACLWSDWAT